MLHQHLHLVLMETMHWAGWGRVVRLLHQLRLGVAVMVFIYHIHHAFREVAAVHLGEWVHVIVVHMVFQSEGFLVEFLVFPLQLGPIT